MYSIFVKKVESYEAKNTLTDSVNKPLLYLGPGNNGYKSTPNLAEDTNPYFQIINTQEMELNEWYLFIGYIRDFKNTSTDIHPTTGLWNLSNILNSVSQSRLSGRGEPVEFTFNEDKATMRLTMRSFLFYDDVNKDTNIHMYKPSIIELHQDYPAIYTKFIIL